MLNENCKKCCRYCVGLSKKDKPKCRINANYSLGLGNSCEWFSEKKATKNVVVNEIVFEVKKVDVLPNLNYPHRTLHDCYSNPSRMKEIIYNKWVMWSSKREYISGLGVESFNTNHFTLGAKLLDVESGEVIGIFRITGNSNILYINKEVNINE